MEQVALTQGEYSEEFGPQKVTIVDDEIIDECPVCKEAHVRVFHNPDFGLTFMGIHEGALYTRLLKDGEETYFCPLSGEPLKILHS